MAFPNYWESLLKGYVKKTFYADTRRKDFADREDFTEGDYRFFANGIRKLSQAFTQERSFLPKNYLNQKELRSGYILYFLPINALKVANLLSEIPPHIFYTAENKIRMRVLDIGSGPGTGVLAVFGYLENLLRGRIECHIELDFVLVDQNLEALRDATALHEKSLSFIQSAHPKWKVQSRLQTIRENIESKGLFHRISQSGVEAFDLMLGLNVLGELELTQRKNLVLKTLSILSEKGRALLMEPALRQTTRDLMKLRDELLETQSVFICAPCLHQKECPMLKANQRDWCHTYLMWQRPVWIEKIDHIVSLRKDYLKCAYLILGKQEAASDEKNVASNQIPLWRVVSGPLNSKGKTERLLCGERALPDLLRVTRLDRDQSHANRTFDELQRGDVVEMQKTTRLTKDTVVKLSRTKT